MKKKKKAETVSLTHKPDGWTIDQWQVALRREFGQTQKFRIKNIGQHEIFSEFSVTNPQTKRAYRVAIRGSRLGDNFCYCPDFSVNTLGTCKHIESVLARLCRKRENKRMLAAGSSLPYSEVFLRYGPRRQVVLRLGSEAPVELEKAAVSFFGKDNVLREDAFALVSAFIDKARNLEHELRCYDDVLSFIAEAQDAAHRRMCLQKRFSEGVNSKFFEHLLKAPLYPYQREGALFAVEAGRALIADDMGLGKTLQAIAAAEILAREFGIEKVLIVCPTTLKHQWKGEIQKFTNRSVSVVEGFYHKRKILYEDNSFFKIVNYDVVFRDRELIERMSPDMVVLDEAQRIKNWKTRTARSVKEIKSPYAIVMTGTPLENRLEELYSLVEFVDRYRLGPMFRFLSNHQELDAENGKVVGYRNLKAIGETLSSILIRRRKSDVLTQLPERLDKNFFVPMTGEQMIIHDENRDIVSKLAAKWRKYRFLSEVDHRRMLIALQYMRMSCNSTYLVDQQTRFGKKLDELAILLRDVFEDTEVKCVIFSQWERMTSLVAEVLEENSWHYTYLHGGVPGAKRKDLIHAFHHDPHCRVFLSTDAGGVGLNLQPASVVVNMDIPWNPAVLEQRIGRVHRLGQHKPVRVVNFVAEGTIEHNMLSLLKFKKSLFAGVLDKGEDRVLMGGSRLSRFMQSIDELTGAKNSDSAAVTPQAAPAVTPSPAEGKEKEFYEKFFSAGAAVLKSLSDGLVTAPVCVEKDPLTGSSSLRISLPEPKVVRAALPAVESFLVLLKQYAGE